MKVGIDLGSTSIRLAHRQDGGTAVEGIPARAVALDDGDGDAIESRDVIEDGDGDRWAVGHAAVERAARTDEPARPILTRGNLDEDWAPGALETLLERVLEPFDSPSVWYTTTGDVLDDRTDTGERHERLEGIFGDSAEQAVPVNRGFAVLYDQLEDDNYTGLGICIDDDITSISLAYYGVPVLSFTIPTGSRDAVEAVARETGDEAEDVSSVFKAFELYPDLPDDGLESAIASALDGLAGEMVAATEREAADADAREGVPVPVAVGGPGAVAGLEYLLGGRFDEADLPFSIRGVRMAEDPAASAARGALVAAQEEVEDYEAISWSGDGEPVLPDSEGEPVARGIENTPSVSALEEDEEALAPEPGGEGTRVEFVSGLEDGPGADSDEAVEQLFDRLEDRSAEVEELVSHVERLSETVDELDSTAVRRDTLQALGADVEELREEVESLRPDLGRLEEHIESVSDQLAEGGAGENAPVAALEETLEAHEEQLEILQDDLEATREVAEGIDLEELDIDVDFDRLQGLELRLNNLESDVDDLNDGLEHLPSEEALDGVDLDGLSDRLAEIEGSLADLKQWSAAFDPDSAGQSEELEPVRDRLERTEHRLDAIEEAFASADFAEADRVDALVDQFRDLREGIADMKQLVERSKDLGMDAAQRVEGMDDRVAALEDELDATNASLEELADRVESLPAEVADAAREGGEAGEADPAGGAEIAREVDRLEDRLEGLESDVDRWSDRIEEADEVSVEAPDPAAVAETVDPVRERVEALESEVQSIDARANAAAGDADGVTDAALSSLEERVDVLDRRVEEVAAAADSASGTDTTDSAPGADEQTAAGATASILLLSGLAGGAGVLGAALVLAGQLVGAVAAIGLSIMILGLVVFAYRH